MFILPTTLYTFIMGLVERVESRVDGMFGDHSFNYHDLNV